MPCIRCDVGYVMIGDSFELDDCIYWIEPSSCHNHGIIIGGFN